MDGNYNVKVGHQAIMEWERDKAKDSPSSSTQQDDIWHKLWALNVPPKHSHLLWRILNEALPVKSNLFRTGIKCDPMCPRCQNQVETLHHAFLDCEWTKQVWFSSILTINLNHNQFNNFVDWFNYLAKHTEKIQLEQITATIYGIWYARNQKAFQNKNLPPTDVSQKAISQLHEYQKVNILTRTIHQSPSTGSSRHNTSWSPPLRCNRKINVDAHLSSDGHWYSGLLLRRSDGSVVGSATRLHQSSESANFGEATGLNDAIDMAEKFGETAITFELDCQSVVNVVLNKATVRREWGFVVNRCVKFLQANPISSIAWVKREMNRPAHELARWAEFEPNMDWPNSYPSCINTYILKDIGSLYPS
ncbi:Ribonuclease H superfamily protein [Trifolium repens]|nr:Ribonuclease H superfamily protein [Trifolium repens]